MEEPSFALMDFLSHIEKVCEQILVRGFDTARRDGMPPSVLMKFLVLQGYLNGAVDTSVAEHEKSSDIDRYAYGEKLKLLLIPVRIELEAKIRYFQEQATKKEGSSSRHRNDRP